MKMNMLEWQQNVLNSSKKTALPILMFPGLEITGKTVLDILTNGEDQFEVMQCLAEKYPSIAAATAMDLSVEAEAFGAEIRYNTNELPDIICKFFTDKASIEALQIPSPTTKRCGEFIKAAKLSAERISDRPTFGGMVGPLSLAGRLLDFTIMMMEMITDPQNVHNVLEKCTEFLTSYAKQFKAAGANGILIAEPAAGLVSPDHCAEFACSYVKRIVDAVQDDSFIVVLHNCGNTARQVKALASTGAKALHFGNRVDMANILPKVPSDILAMGNIDPAGAFHSGSAKKVRQEVLNLLDKCKGYKNFVLSSGCDIPPQTPLSNVDAFFAALEEYNGDGA